MLTTHFALLVTLLLAALATAASVQTPNASADTTNAWLAKAAALYYYSTAKNGPAGFDCAVHPDWRTMISSADNGAQISNDDPRLVLTSGLRPIMHAHLKGGSGIEWQPPTNPAPNKRVADLLTTVQQATDQTLSGFLYFWIPLLNGSIIPAPSDGVKISPNANGEYKIEATQSEMRVTEILDSTFVLRDYRANMSGSTTIQLTPTYTTTPRGLLVTDYVVHAKRGGGSARETRVGVSYGLVSGIKVPAQIDIDEGGTAPFRFTLDGCTVSQQ